MKPITLLILILFLIGTAFSGDNLVHRKIRFTKIPRTVTPPVIDGKLDDVCWQSASVLSDFVLTAGKPGEKSQYPTECYMLYDDTHLYVAFRCVETDLNGMKSTSVQWDDLDILYDDRVELFLDVNHDHRNYFEFAVNPKGVLFDQSGYNRLHGSKTCDMEPRWNGRWQAKTSIGKDAWSAELMVDVTSLGYGTIEDGTTWGVNVARARRPHVNRGDEFFKKKPEGEAEYSAWALVQDYIRETISNFHAPIEFGDMVFGDPEFEVNQISLKSALYAFGPLGVPSTYGWNPLEIRFDGKKKKKAVLELTVEPETQNSWHATQEILIDPDKTLEVLYWIPEMLENKIIARVLDPKTKKQLYRTSYIELTPPFIEFNLEPLYTRKPKIVEPVQYRVLMDEKTRSSTKVSLEFKERDSGKVVAKTVMDDLFLADDFQPVFKIQRLRALRGGDYAIDCTLLNKQDGNEIAFFRQNLTKFNNSLPETFKVLDGDYSYGGITDHAVRIQYPFGAEFVFWAKASYIPYWDLDQAAMTNEFVENWGGGNQGCCEPMQDRENRYIQVKILESSEARAVIHWRYALSDPHYRIYFNEWVDEYYVLYPDGVGGRQVNLWPNVSTRHESFEVLLAKPPGVQTEQLFDEKFATLTNLLGEGYSNKYLNLNRDFHREFVAKHKEFVVEVHFKDRLHPFTVFSLRDDLLPGVTPAHVAVCARDIGHADRRGHWPASRYQIDGYNTPGLDVPHHGNIGNIQAEVDIKNQPTTWTYLVGVQKEGSEKAQNYAKSWLYPGKFEPQSRKIRSDGFDHAQRAYRFSMNKKAPRCELQFKAEKGSITNPVFLIAHAGYRVSEIHLDDRKLEPQDYKTGKTHDGQIVVYINSTVMDGQLIKVHYSKI